MNARTSWVSAIFLLACSGSSDGSPSPSDTGDIDPVDACALLPSATVSDVLQVEETITAAPDNGTFIGEFAGTCGYTWGDGTHRLSFTVEFDPGNEYLDRYREFGLPLTTPVTGVGEVAFLRADGALVWGYDDQRLYVLLGQRGGATMPIEQAPLVELAQTITRP